MDKLTKGKFNFENVLASQNCVFEKCGIAFNPQNKNSGSLKLFSTFAENNRLKDRNNRLFPAFIVWEEVILLDSVKWEKILFPETY